MSGVNSENVRNLLNGKLKQSSSSIINIGVKVKKTICLNMIVKNEAHIISETFDNLLQYISFDYWVISDTGSTDGTQQLIKDYFHSKNIKGELHEDAWRDFGYNRTLALEYAKGKTDYLLIFDADDSINGDFKLPQLNECNIDMYNFKFGVGVSYVRPLLINNSLDWVFNGVLHEYLSCKTKNIEGYLLDGNYYVDSGRKGSRSSDPDKYKKDAEILKKAYYVELDKPDKGLSGRYAFYCAQSYKDCWMNRESIEWYKIVADQLNSWNQEKCYSCLSLGELYRREKDFENSIKYYTKSIMFDHERIEGIAFACEVLQNSEQYLLCCCLGKNYLGHTKQPLNKLFLFDFCYRNHIEYSCSISAFYCGMFDFGYECCKKIITSNIAENDVKYIKTCSNLSFYKEQLIKDTTDTLTFFYLYNDVIQNIMNSGDTNASVDPKIHECWNILFEKNRAKLTEIPQNIKNNYRSVFTNSNKKLANASGVGGVGGTSIETIITFTTCKRFDLFKETVGSILNHWLDKEKIAYWFCVDDNSSKDDRALMRATFPWIKYHMKTESERGHRESMNIIWNKLQEIKPKYWIHMEDDFLFYTKRNYVEDSIKVLKKYAANNIRQILFNRNYAETIEHTNTRGHIVLADDAVIPEIPVLFHNHNTVDKFYYSNCCYWPDYSFRPSMIDVGTILSLGNYNTENQFFEMDYAKRWYNAGYRSAFYNLITCRHIGRLTSDRGDKTKPNSYELNNVSQFNTSNSSISPVSPDSPDARSDEEIRKVYSPPIKVSTDSYIKIVNMKHRIDRKNSTIQQLAAADFPPDEYDFIEAIYGKELKPSQELYTLFKDNDFGSRCGVMGCALSHYGLWLELLKDQKNDYYLIMEDDFTLCGYFKHHLEKLRDGNTFIEKDVIFFGYHMYNLNKQKFSEVYINNNITDTTGVKIEKLNKDIYLGATHCYSINKTGAKKLIDYIYTNGIKHGIDYVMKIHDTLDAYETRPHLATAAWDENGETFDTDIQHDRDSIDFNYFIKINSEEECTKIINQYFIFVPKLDQIGCDLYHKNTGLANMVLEAIKDKQCNAFNTLGFFKHDIKTLTSSQWFGDKDGIYIKKEYYNKCINRDKRERREKCDNSDIKEILNGNLDNRVNRVKHVKRIKMICNWCSSYELCKEWSNMCTDADKFMWNNIEITWDNDDNNIDYYVIINMPRAGEYYDPKRTIVFQMEPWVYDTSKNWGVKMWGEWAEPRNADFMGVFRHKEQLNNVQWQVALPAHIPGNDKSNRIISIISNKNIDEGHIKRIDFLKCLDKSNIDVSSKIDVYGRENYHNLKRYVGTTDDKLEMGKYKYCFSCENNNEKNYATEKIWEPILFECLCFYWGCPNLEDYIDSRAFVRLPLDDIDGCISIITKAIEEDWWSQRIDIIRREKQKIINELGFFPRLDKFIDNL